MGALPKTDQDYINLIKSFKETDVAGEQENLRRYHSFGQLFVEYCNGLSSNKYGDRTVATLAEDLVENGVLRTIKDPQRFLYWAKALYNRYPDYKKLSKLATQGFTVSHAKLLLSARDEVLPLVENKMMEAGMMVTVVELDNLIKSEDRKLLGEKAAEAAEPPVETGDEAEPEKAVPAAKEGDDDPGNDESGDPEDAGQPEAEAGEASPEEKPEVEHRAAPTVAEVDMPSPLKTVNSLEKQLTRVVSELPDAFIVLREIGKRGFDSDRAHNKFKDAVANLNASIVQSIEPLQKLREEAKAYLDGEAG